MKVIKLHCPTCKKDIKFETDEPVIPASFICVKCRGQVWLREIRDKDAK